MPAVNKSLTRKIGYGGAGIGITCSAIAKQSVYLHLFFDVLALAIACLFGYAQVKAERIRWAALQKANARPEADES